MMAEFLQRQRKFLESFLKNSTTVMRHGISYLRHHPELIQTINQEWRKIRKMEELQEKYPKRKDFCQTIIRNAYTNYIMKLTHYGFLYVKCNPTAYDEVAKLRKVFDEYDNLRTEASVDLGNPSLDDQMWDETFKQINDLNNKLVSLQTKIESTRIIAPVALKSSHDILKKMNKELEKRLKELEDKKKAKLEGVDEPNKRKSVKCPSPCKIPNRSVKQINELLEKNLHQIKMMKLQRPPDWSSDEELIKNLKDPILLNKAKTSPPMKKEPSSQKTFPGVKNPRERNFVKVEPKKVALNVTGYDSTGESDNYSSEVFINSEDLSPGSTKKLARAGVIERNIIIPVEGGDPLKINPEFLFKKSTNTGEMQIDLKLNFEEGIIFQDKLVDGMIIENALPIQNFHSKRK